MASRMEKYHSKEDPTNHSRSAKNKNLYENLYNNQMVTEFTNVENENIVNLSDLTKEPNFNRREFFQKRKLFANDSIGSPSTQNILTKTDSNEVPLEERNYNINDILEQAKKNRSKEDSQEEKQRFKTVEYSILEDLSQEKVKEQKEKKKTLSKDEEENLEELIHTITSNSLRKRIDEELLGDLLPTDEDESIISPELLQDIKEKAETYVPTKEEKEETEEMDQSFYTRSMDLSEHDFVSNDEEEEDRSFLEEAKMSFSKKLLIILFVLLIIGIIGYIIYRFV